MISVKLAALMMLACIYCSTVVSEEICSELYGGNRDGHFEMKDPDQSFDLKKDYRVSKEGWHSTYRLHIMAGCTLTVCDDTNFKGSCTTHEATKGFKWVSGDFNVQSAKCTCGKVTDGRTTEEQCKAENENLKGVLNQMKQENIELKRQLKQKK